MIYLKVILFGFLFMGVVYVYSRIQAKAWSHEISKQIDKYLNSKQNKLKKETDGKNEIVL